MLEAEGKLAGHLQIVMHDWPREAKQNTIDHVLAALKEQREHERDACATRLTMAELEIERLRHPFRNADKLDWEHLFKMLPDSGHGKFWKAVLTEAKAALAA
jgi:hypothetical protein